MTYIMKIGEIDKNRLSKTQFMISLLREGFREGVIEKRDLDRIGFDMMLLLKDLIIRYTKGESTSLKVDTAEMLMNSVCYSIDAGLAGCSSPEESIAVLKSRPLKEIYDEGLRCVTACVKQIRELVAEMKRIRLDIPLEAYNATIESIPAFFNGYSVMFTPHNSVASIDYPLVFDDWNVRGAFYMRNYIETLNIETKICRLFSNEDIISVLESYGKVYNIDYTKCLINIFELTVSNAVFSVLSGSHAKKIVISREQYQALSQKLSGMCPEELSSYVNDGFKTAIKELEIKDPQQKEYLLRYKEVFLSTLKSSIKNNGLDKIIIYKAGEERQPDSLIINHGERLKEKDFLTLLKKLSSCRSVREKAEIILSGISSSEDFIDILESDCFYGDEYLELYSELRDIELSILGKSVFYEELRQGTYSLSLINIDDIRTDREWQQYYVQFVKALEGRRRQEIERYLNMVSYDNEIAYD